MKHKLKLLLLLLAFAFVQCTEKKKQAEAQETVALADTVKKASVGAAQFEVAADFQRQLSSLFTAYLSLKESLVASNSAGVKTQAGITLQALKNIDMHLLSGPAHHDWMTYTAGMDSALTGMQSSGDLEAQRTAFSSLSDNLYKSIKAYGLGGTTAYYDFCPMAFQNKGGYWLSDQETIRNPYFGDQMLTCGSVQETLK